MQNKLNALQMRLEELNSELSSEEATKDMDRYKKISKEHSDILPVVDIYQEFTRLTKDINDAKEMLSDPEMKSFAQDEIDSGKEKIMVLEEQLQTLLLPKDPNDEKNIFLEIRAGAGGDESALFAGDIFRMYTRYTERMGWQLEVISSNESEVGGFKEIIAKIIGQGLPMHSACIPNLLQVPSTWPRRLFKLRTISNGIHIRYRTFKIRIDFYPFANLQCRVF